MLFIKTNFKNEDIMSHICTLLRQNNNIITEIITIDGEQRPDEVGYVIKYNSSMWLNRLITDLKDQCELFRIEVKFCYIYSIGEAYTETQKGLGRYLPFATFTD